MRLPYPYTLESLLEAPADLKVFVAEARAGQVNGALAVLDDAHRPQLIGPLVSDDQLADLFGRALVDHGVAWARAEGRDAVETRIDLDDERGLGLYTHQGFTTTDRREYALVATARELSPAALPDGLTVGPSADMLSSDYVKLHQSTGTPLGRTDWSQVPRPQVFEHLQRAGMHLLALRDGDKFVGFAELEDRGPGVAELLHFGLIESHRGGGLGGQFLDHVLAYAWDQLHLQEVRVSTRSTDAPQALPNFARHGFRKERAMVVLEKLLDAPEA
jgi:GNAT superfamily N-acetyltransferase